MTIKEAIEKAECIDVNYGNRTPEEIEELDEALDIVFLSARKLAEIQDSFAIVRPYQEAEDVHRDDRRSEDAGTDI